MEQNVTKIGSVPLNPRYNTCAHSLKIIPPPRNNESSIDLLVTNTTSTNYSNRIYPTKNLFTKANTQISEYSLFKNENCYIPVGIIVGISVSTAKAYAP